MKSSSLEIHPEGDRTLLFSGVWTQLQLKLSLNQLWVTSKPGLAHPEDCGRDTGWSVWRGQCMDHFRGPCARTDPSKARDPCRFRKKNDRKNGDQFWKFTDGRSRDVTVPKDQLGNSSSAAPYSLAPKPSQIHAVGTAGELRIPMAAQSKDVPGAAGTPIPEPWKSL